jgi:hypothetical protein
MPDFFSLIHKLEIDTILRLINIFVIYETDTILNNSSEHNF